MEHLEKLFKEANPLMSYASELESAITKVSLVCDRDDDDNNIFPAKKEVIEAMANSVEKMRLVATLLNEVINSATETVSSMDATVLSFFRDNYEEYQKVNDKLGAVLCELVKKLDLDGTGIEVYLLHYVSFAMEWTRALLEVIKDIDYTSK